jgi:GT2 family glycosyltransferase
MKPIRLVCGTRATYDDFPRTTALGRTLALGRHAVPPQLMLFDNNRAGLSSIYNYAIEQSRNDPAILVFLHDDVHLCDFFWMDKLREAVAQFDIVGLAGNVRRLPAQPSWFFRDMTFTPDDAQNLSGVVGHGKGFPCDKISVYGPPARECKLLDGLLLAADSERLIASGVSFDEQFDFHFYDLDFCRQAEARGLRMGTWPMSVIHESGGAFNTPPWRAAYERYMHKYMGV